MFKWLTLALLSIACVQVAMAQMSPSTMLSWGRPPMGGQITPAYSGAGNVRLHSGFHRHHPLLFGDPFFYPEEPPVSLAYELPSPPVIVTPKPSAPEPPAEPLLIEWKGDRFVRSGGVASARSDVPDYSEAALEPAHSVSYAARSQSYTKTTPAELPPAVLVYRDGRNREVSDYVIARGALYARSDYVRTGSWTEIIQLSALDLPATVKLNDANGVKFVLPAGPSEVVTRP